ncbi:hypothetical protein D3C71_1393270 [compost metagenome]
MTSCGALPASDAPMYKQVVVTRDAPTPHDAYVGGGAFLPDDVQWPGLADGLPLVHLAAFPADWFYPEGVALDFWISVFIPVDMERFSHLDQLRLHDGSSAAAVIAYRRSSRQHCNTPMDLLEAGRLERVDCHDEDDEDNLDSKVDGVDAWLQAPLAWPGGRRRLAIYGADIDAAMPSRRGMLFDGMGYLFLSDRPEFDSFDEIGAFCFQLG